ncbi:MAG: hypothetical protein J5588_02230 [Bacteroidales bacterium]|nr:hypothetical protein [Bacteroidales bacterium]
MRTYGTLFLGHCCLYQPCVPNGTNDENRPPSVDDLRLDKTHLKSAEI